ncbi:MAG: T9SS type A sorting domain-containing protein, partial [Bacteroidetes Order II. Incertae sedis bacterium]|nr:T9SS type A sorting domain-containing protein [Bacteroidetes Order II. bacterium]
IYISDDGGSDNNGFDASADQSFMVEIVNDTANEDQAIPTEFTLSGAYPNPFNPTTTIQFGLPAAADVQVQVFDLTGRMVMTVPSKTFTAGAKHSVRLNASTLASGSYYYRVLASLSGGTEVKVGSFVLLK